MLILNRKFGEAIVIGEGDKQVTVTVVQIYRDQVRLGIEAPKEVLVRRREVADRIAAEQAERKWLNRLEDIDDEESM